MVTAVILAGGLGKRMGGMDKGFVVYLGHPMISHVVQRISRQVEHIVINANRNLVEYEALGYPVVPDLNTDFLGPLAGIQAALHTVKDSFLLSVPCDSPYLPEDLTDRMQKSIEATNADVAFARSPSGLHPVFCLIKTHLKESLDEYLAKGGRKVSTWLEQQNFVITDFMDERAFTNINYLTEKA